ncbi:MULTISPECIES: helix-turn-helix domain-containing protein [Legionella]|uniref:Putative DNA-binding transcriptional regulator n=1 Tax=Legionella steelei TaxID=947033 RepID=A0A0W0ZFC6_9GAMM|nr:MULTISPECIES: helix-turn-helix domain-containing protein [Legionella]KTD67819.1 putative DNA-binding transcriptional regulator [Legionella steelei]MBN9228076.1 helix-turn-helix domain-containing protein [Legionella steelei]OJW11335.1 MAG: transcriptional regulator [Legionella sp. 39-23]
MLIHSPQELALLIKNQRKKLQLSQAEVADLVGLKQKTISAIENNPENMRLSTLFRILSALSLDFKASEKNAPHTTTNQWNDEW